MKAGQWIGILVACVVLAVAAPLAMLVLASDAAITEQLSQSPPSPYARQVLATTTISVALAAAQQCTMLAWQVMPAVALTIEPDVMSRLDVTTGAVADAHGSPVSTTPVSTTPVSTTPASSTQASSTQASSTPAASNASPTTGLGPFGFSAATWATYETTWPGAPAGATPDPNNLYDGAYAFAEDLCGELQSTGDLKDALAAYDASPGFEQQVWSLAVELGMNDDGSSSSLATAGSVATIPPAMLALYQQAARASCSGLSWSVLAAIGTVESGNGTSTLAGVESGHNSAGAMGPMQMLAGTFAEYASPVEPGGATPPSPYDATDAVYAAARMLCANGAANGANLGAAVFSYNHASWYVGEVLDLAQQYQAQGTSTTPLAGSGPPANPSPYPIAFPSGQSYEGSGRALVSAVESYLGVPYLWGGTSRSGVDCSGLVVVAMQALGFDISATARTAELQATLGTTIPLAQLQPGDLLFYEGSESGGTPLGHVAIYVGRGEQVAAPQTGEVVQFQPVAWSSVEIARQVLTQP